MTEDYVLAHTGLSLRTHQRITVVDYLRLRDLDPELPFHDDDDVKAGAVVTVFDGHRGLLGRPCDLHVDRVAVP